MAWPAATPRMERFRQQACTWPRNFARLERHHDRRRGNFRFDENGKQRGHPGKPHPANCDGVAHVDPSWGVQSDGEWGPFREWRHDLFWNDCADNHASVFDAIDRQRDGHDGPTREHFHHGEKSGSGRGFFGWVDGPGCEQLCNQRAGDSSNCDDSRGSQQSFSATVTGSTNQSVTWSVNGVAGGSAATGMISAQGMYRRANCTAQSECDHNHGDKRGGFHKTRQQCGHAGKPATCIDGNQSQQHGRWRIPDHRHGKRIRQRIDGEFGGQAVTATFVSPTQLTATGTATVAQVGSVPVTVTNPNPGGATSAVLMVQIVNSGTVVSAAAQCAS